MLVLLITSVAVYWRFFYQPKPAEPTNIQATTSGQTPTQTTTQTTIAQTTPAQKTIITNPKQTYGTLQFEPGYGDKSNFAISYPKTDNAGLNRIIAEKLASLKQAFQTASAENKPGLAVPEKDELHIEYESWLSSGRYANIKFLHFTSLVATSGPYTEVSTIVFDLQTGKQLFLTDLIDINQPELQKYMRDDIKSQLRVQGETDLLDKNNILSGKTAFALTDDELQLYFDPGVVLPKYYGVIKVSLKQKDFPIHFPEASETTSSTETEATSSAQIETSATSVETSATSTETSPAFPGRIVDPAKPMIALTFDDGPNSATTLRIIKALKDNGSVATFFTLGNRVKDGQATLQAMLNANCEIGNHSFNHKSFVGLSLADLHDQIDTTDNLLKEAGVPITGLLRPPYGAIDDTVKNNTGKTIILWDVDTRDWESRDATAVAQHIMTHLADGNIILMHDIYESTASAAEQVIPKIIAEGYQLVTISELLQAKGLPEKAGTVYYDAE